MSLHNGAKTRVRVHSELPEEFEAIVEIHQRSVLSSFLFAAVIDDVIELARWWAKWVVVCQWLSSDEWDNHGTQ